MIIHAFVLHQSNHYINHAFTNQNNEQQQFDCSKKILIIINKPQGIMKRCIATFTANVASGFAANILADSYIKMKDDKRKEKQDKHKQKQFDNSVKLFGTLQPKCNVSTIIGETL